MRTTFIDGPAKGQALTLRRAPIMLRVVCKGGVWDALDQLEDKVRPGEEVHVYRLTGPANWMHMRCAKPSQGGMFFYGGYALSPFAPAEEVLRDNKLWSEWCNSSWEQLCPDWARGKVGV